MYLYMPKIQCILYGPEYIPIPLMRHTILTKGFLPKPAVKKAAAKKKVAAKKKAAAPAKKKASP
jgi:hypothetical protein